MTSTLLRSLCPTVAIAIRERALEILRQSREIVTILEAVDQAHAEVGRDRARVSMRMARLCRELDDRARLELGPR